MKKRITVQVTFESTVEVDIPDNAGFVSEDELFDMGMEISDTLNDLTSVDLGGVAKGVVYWSKTHTEIWDESTFVGDEYC